MRGRRLAGLAAFVLASTLLVAGLVALAVWQIHRRASKLDLIARLEKRALEIPSAAPGPERWAEMSAASDEYRRVTASGTWLEDRSALVRAVTELGGGAWVMTPLLREDGTVILVNRGFVPADKRDPTFWRLGGTMPATVTGLLRMSEPGGAFLRANDPESNRWFSRDVAAIGRSRGIAGVAPYFIDLERGQGDGGLPVAGLTILRFSNNHLLYAITWATLALMVAAGATVIIADQYRSHLRSPETQRRSRPGHSPFSYRHFRGSRRR